MPKELVNALDVEKAPRGKVYSFLDSESIKRMCGKDMKFAKFPILLDFSDPKLFKLRSLEGFDAISPLAVKELNLDSNKITNIQPAECFTNMSMLSVRNNLLASITFDVQLRNLEELHVAHNQISEIPDLTKMPNLRVLDLSHNLIGGENPFEPFSKKCKKLRELILVGNGINLSPYAYVEQLKHLRKDKVPKLRDIDLRLNPITKLQHYRAWTATNITSNIEFLDGEEVLKSEKKDKPPKPEMTEKESESSPNGEKSNVKAGPGKPHKPMSQTTYVFDDFKGLLVKCFDQPMESVPILAKLEDLSITLVELGPTGRYIDYKPMDPQESVDDFMQSISLILQRLPQLANTSLRILARFASVLEDPLGPTAKETILKLMDMQGLYNESIWLAIRDVLVPALESEDIIPTLRKVYLEILYLASVNDFRAVQSVLFPLVPALIKAINERDPEYYILGIVAAASSDIETGIALREQGVCERVIELVNIERKNPQTEKFRHLVRIVSVTAYHDPDARQKYIEQKLEHKMLKIVNEMTFDAAASWPDESSNWAAEVILCADALALHDTAMMVTLQSDYVKRILEIIQYPDVRPRLLAASIKAARHVLERTTDKALHEVIAKGIGYGVPLLDYIEGLSYEALCRLSGAVKDGEALPLSELTDRNIYMVLKEIVTLIGYFAERAEQDDETSRSISQALDSAARERYLFSLLVVPDDNLRLETINCLRKVPLSNFEKSEVDEIVMLLEVKSISAGRTEEVLAIVLEILESIAYDRNEQGEDFRLRHSKVVLKVLSILLKNSSRDTSNSEKETEQKASLSEACVSFLLAASTWDEAVEVMRTDMALEMGATILQCEEAYGSSERPVWLEKTGVCSTIKAGFHFLKTLTRSGVVAHRIVARMASIIEGPERMPPEEDEENQDAKVWERRNTASESEKDFKFRADQCKYLLDNDGVTKIINFLHGVGLTPVDPPEDPDPTAFPARDIISDILVGAEKMEHQMALKEARNEKDMLFDENDDVALQNEHSSVEAAEQEKIDRKKRRMIENAAGNSGEDDLGDVEDEFAPPKPIGRLQPQTGELEVVYSEHGAILSSALRLFLAVCWYGDVESQERIRARLKETLTIRSLAILARTAGWFSFNIGYKFALLGTELFQLPVGMVTEPVTSLPIYDLFTQILAKILVIGDRRLSERKVLAPRQELVMNQACLLWHKILILVSYIKFTALEKREIEEACVKELFAVLLPPSCLNMMIRFLYYDKQVVLFKLLGVNSETPHQIQPRDRARYATLNCIAEYMQMQDDNKYWILEFFNRLEISEKVTLDPHFMQFLLEKAIDLKYHSSLEYYMQENFYFPHGNPERILAHDWMDLAIGLEKQKRLVVFSNKRWYILKDPFGQKCDSCPPDKFCPKGPVLLEKLSYDSIKEVVIGYNRLRMQLKVQEKILGIEKPAVYYTLVVDKMFSVDSIVAALKEVLPDSVRFIDDEISGMTIQVQLDSPGTEVMLLVNPITKTNFRGAKQKRLEVMTNHKIYNFKENFRYWQGNNTSFKDAKKAITLSSSHEIADIEAISLCEGSKLRMDIKFKSGQYRYTFADFVSRDLWSRTLAEYVDPAIIEGKSVKAILKGKKGKKE